MENSILKDLFADDLQLVEHVTDAHCYVYMVYTDSIQITHIRDVDFSNPVDKLLECRIFGDAFEIRKKRSGLGDNWYSRYIDDSEVAPEDIFDCEYFLDIDADTIREDASFCPTAGVKRYTLPIELKTQSIKMGDEKERRIVMNKLKIRNYVDYYETTGQAYIREWRLMGFEE